MKFFRLLLIAALLPLFFACQKEPVSDAPPDPPSSADPHKVPVATALAELNSMLEAIDEPDTRSGGARRVASVEALRAADLAPNTREATDAPAHIGELVYIANFEDGEGYAILGADDRIESVIAVTEQGSLTTTQLAAAAKGEYDGVDAPPVIPEVGEYLTAQLGKNHQIRFARSVSHQRRLLWSMGIYRKEKSLHYDEMGSGISIKLIYT